MAGPSFSYDIGYSGVVKIGGAAGGATAKQVLATGGSMSVQYTPLYTSGVWGAGWYNATEKIAYAPNYVTLSSSVNYQLTEGITSALQDWAFDKRNEAQFYCILPNGSAGYSGTAYCTGCSFSASQDAIVSGDISLKTGDIQGSITTGSLSSTDSLGKGSLSSFCAGYLDVYPFWASGVYFNIADNNSSRTSATSASSLQADVLDWSASYSSDLVFVMTCCGTSDTLSTADGAGVLQAKYCCLGTMDATGSFTIFKISDALNPNAIRSARNCHIQLAKSSGQGQCKILFGKIILDSGSTDLQNGTSFIQSSFNFSALGNGSSPPMKFQVVSTK